MVRMFGGLSALISLVALVGAVSAFATGALSSAASVSVVAGKPTEFKFTVSKKTVPKGIVVFKVANRGRVTHDFRIAGKKTKRLAPGKMTTLSVVLKKTGKYAYLCTVPGHAQGGMKGVLTVR
jgi:uncharacterized cupredoxin-like copper-binding protein